jgi:hypothetical protein
MVPPKLVPKAGDAIKIIINRYRSRQIGVRNLATLLFTTLNKKDVPKIREPIKTPIYSFPMP